ncbi:MAG: polysaccharide deacetylase family protein, partial [Candidatus Thermoplasmatota archaeon]
EFLPSHVEKNFKKLLDIFSEKNVHVTCFFLGWIAEKFPNLVKEACDRGHEIASHGYSHKLVYEMTEKEFFQDAVRSKAIIENIIGRKILGYRSSGFSVTESTPWFFEKLIEAGYHYDSSVFPSQRGHGGLKTENYAPYLIVNKAKRIIEFPITVAKFFGKTFCFFGGGYLRFFPYFIIKKMTLKVLKEGRPVVFYIHPREIDPNQPRLPMDIKRRLKSYVNLKTTERKIRRILDDFEITTFEKFIINNPNLFER